MQSGALLYSTNDSLSTDSAQTDSVRRRKAGIDSPVEYTANDSLVYEAGTNFAYLFGQANVNYQGMK